MNGLQEYYATNAQEPFDPAFGKKEIEKSSNQQVFECIALCQRNSQKIQDSENQFLWFQLLDSVLQPLRKTRHQLRQDISHDERVANIFNNNNLVNNNNDFNMQDLNQNKNVVLEKQDANQNLVLEKFESALSFLMKNILESMIGFVGLKAILDKIVKEHGNEEFGVRIEFSICHLEMSHFAIIGFQIHHFGYAGYLFI